MSTRETVNRGFDAVATTVMRYRCSVEATAALWGGMPVGTNTTSSRSNTRCTSLAATRCPWWIGSKVPPITPIRRRVLPAGRAALRALTAAPSVAVRRVGRGPRADVPVGDVAVRPRHGAEQREQADRDDGEHDAGDRELLLLDP